MSDPRRRLPGVDRLLESDATRDLLERWPRNRVLRALRLVLDDVRRGLDPGESPADLDDPARWAREAAARLRREDRPSLRPVVNATGVVLHTNLGRAPLADAAREAMARAGEGYSNLEFDLESGQRGSRYVHCVELLRELTGAEDALVVNNCAAGLVLALNTLARGSRVLVSRGELVEIGGGFRIPEMLERAGAELGEVGSTNRTRVVDYEREARGGGAAAMLKVHRSNFRMSGFTEEAPLEELCSLGDALGLPVVHDLGSGLLADPELLGLPPEPRPPDSVAAGADVVSFSGDKLLGGPQAGILVGRSRWIGAMRKNPLCRALRVDKVTLAGLEATLALYRDPADAVRRIPALAALAAEPEALEERARALARDLEGAGAEVSVEAGTGRVGGGTYPGVGLPTWTVRIDAGAEGGASALAARLRRADPPVVGRVEEGRVVLDLRTVLPGEEDAVVAAVVGPERGDPGGAPP